MVPLVISAVHTTFTRDERRYCIFSVAGREEEFLWYSHTSRPLRSLMFGKNFLRQMPDLLENDHLCIECGLGLSVAGGWHWTMATSSSGTALLRRLT
jgi:hypothetical protein